MLVEPVLYRARGCGEAFDGGAREPADLDFARRDGGGARLAAEGASEEIAGREQSHNLLAAVGQALQQLHDAGDDGAEGGRDLAFDMDGIARSKAPVPAHGAEPGKLGVIDGPAKAFLERREPKTDWTEIFDNVRAVRPSARLAEGWDRDGSRLFLSPPLYNEALLVQYLVSRSHEHGGRTLEGRLTLMELIHRLRRGGYLTAHGITATDQFEILEKLLDEVAGSGQLKVYFIVDRREFLEKVKTVYASYAT